MKVLLAGGAGFIGSHLAEALIKKGYEVDILDNFSSGLETNISNIMDKVKVIRQDIIDYHSTDRYDIVMNFASRASRAEWESHPVDVALSNAIGSKNLIEIALNSDALYIYASSSEVYGNASVIPTPEEYVGCVSTTGSRSPYDEGKRFGEALTKAYERQYGLKNIIIRFFNTYGPRMRGDDLYGRVVDRFVNQAISNKPITVYGDGKQTRSFTYISDTVDGILTVIERGRASEIYNIGSDKEIEILELAHIVKRVTGSKSEIIFKPLPEGDPRRRAADITKIRALGWSPKISIEEGIRLMLKARN